MDRQSAADVPRPGLSVISPDMVQADRPVVALLAQSDAALEVLRHAEQVLDRFGVAWAASIVRAGDEERVVPELEAAGVGVIIVANAAAEPLSAGLAHLTRRPVLAVPTPPPEGSALHSLQSSATAGAPVGTLAIGKAGAINAALLAVAILANADAALRRKLEEFRLEQTQRVLEERLD